MPCKIWTAVCQLLTCLLCVVWPDLTCFAPFRYQCIYFTVVKSLALKNRMVPICLYCLNCTKFGQLIFRNIIKIVATRCQILRLKWTRFDFGSAPDPAGGSLQRSPRPVAGFKGPTSKGREGKGRERRRGERKLSRNGTIKRWSP